ncbi:aldo/keto reductase [Streptomyces sp. NPDC015532]|uniref:aldo/keto reductase n=1 Tax=Streptomyces sp. NPDC015532 TaxID=3364960 RepID=UPI0036F762E8
MVRGVRFGGVDAEAQAGCALQVHALAAESEQADEENTRRAFETSLRELGLDHLDLYLMHQPFADVYGQWRAMEAPHHEGHIKAIGVANFYPDRLVDLISNNEVVPTVNQVEAHPFFQRTADQYVMRKHGRAGRTRLTDQACRMSQNQHITDVLSVGATGTIGLLPLRAAQCHGVRPRALVRDPRRAARQPPGIELARDCYVSSVEEPAWWRGPAAPGRCR